MIDSHSGKVVKPQVVFIQSKYNFDEANTQFSVYNHQSNTLY